MTWEEEREKIERIKEKVRRTGACVVTVVQVKGGQDVEQARRNGAEGGRPASIPKQYLDHGVVKTEMVMVDVQRCSCGYETNIVGDLTRHRKSIPH